MARPSIGPQASRLCFGGWWSNSQVVSDYLSYLHSGSWLAKYITFHVSYTGAGRGAAELGHRKSRARTRRIVSQIQ